MSASDVWDVRLPDGRGLRGLDTETVQGHIRAGRLPRATLVRRTDEEDWIGLDWVPEFASVLVEPRPTPTTAPQRPPLERRASPPPDGPGATVAERLETNRLGCAGVPRILREVLTAFDVTLLPIKLRLVAILGSLGGLLFLLPERLFSLADWIFWVQCGIGLILLALGGAAISQVVYVELTRQRAGRWRDARRGLVVRTLRFLLALLLVPGTGVALLAGLLWLAQPGTIPESADHPLAGEIISWTAATLALLLAIPLIAVGPMALMLAPIFIVEECGVVHAIGQWLQILRQNLRRALLYDLLATGVMVAFVAIPALLIWLPGRLPFDPRFRLMVEIVQAMLGGMLIALVLTYLLVVQVFLYLNLRFEVEPG